MKITTVYTIPTGYAHIMDEFGVMEPGIGANEVILRMMAGVSKYIDVTGRDVEASITVERFVEVDDTKPKN